MGYLTTLTIYNDGIDSITDDAEALNEKIKNASHEGGEVGHKGFCNLVQVQKSRHADEHTIYVHMGNCVTELNPYTKETKKLIANNPAFSDRMIAFMEMELKALKKLRKELRG